MEAIFLKVIDQSALPYILERGMTAIKNSKSISRDGCPILAYLARYATENEQSKKIFAKVNKNFQDLDPDTQRYLKKYFPQVFGLNKQISLSDILKRGTTIARRISFPIKIRESLPADGEMVLSYLARYAPEHEQSKKIFAEINKNFHNIDDDIQESLTGEFPNIFGGVIAK
jgi:hypothetical protein